ncbi:MAG: DUF4041 domain-containing protein [Kofleriaceae bacterium]
MTWKLLTIVFGCATAGLTVLVISQLASLSRLRHRFAGIVDLDHEIAIRRAAFDRKCAQQQAEIAGARQRATEEVADTMRTARELRAHHASSKATYDRLRHEINVLQRASDDFSFGLYEPTFAFSAPEDYKRALVEAREQQRAAVSGGHAIRCKDSWTFGDNRKASARMQQQYARVLLRAFNGECTGAIARISWNNVTRTIERVKLAFEAINKLGSELQVEITTRYRDLKLDELRLEYELAQKRHDEKDEQREVHALQLEELRAQQELDRAREDAGAEARRAQAALDAVRDQLAGAHGAELDEHLGKIAAIQREVSAAQQREATAVARAQQTRAGYVYVLSNIGSFGDTVYKIGMTRRLDPLAHVRELGDGALPFRFDVHAMIRTDDAPALEAKLHQELHDRRLNLVDGHSTFFHATLDEVEAFVKSQGLEIHVTRAPEAQQYRASNAARRKLIAPARPPAREAGSFAFAMAPDDVATMPDPPSDVPSGSAAKLIARLVPGWQGRSRAVAAPYPEETPVG